jgi:hypothetical protein
MCLSEAVSSLVPALVSAAVATGGTMYNAHQTSKQQNKQSEAASRATLQNLERQRAQGAKSREMLQQRTPEQAQPQQQVRLDDATRTREAGINANVNQVADYSPTPGSSPKVVGQAQRRKADEGRSKVAAENAALAKLGGWGDAQRQNQVDLGRTGGQIAENNSFVRGTAGLLPMEQNTAVTNATNKYAPNPWGDVAMAAGNAGVSAFYPQAPMPTFADVLGMQQSKRKPRGGGGASTGRGM